MLPGYQFGDPNRTITGNKFKEFNVQSKVTCTNANAVYAISNPLLTVGGSSSAILNGTNLLTHVELIVTLNDWTAPSGSGASVKVQLFRTISNDGTSTNGMTIVDEFGMDNSSVVRIPAIQSGEAFSVLPFKIATSSAGAVFNITMKGVYFSP